MVVSSFFENLIIQPFAEMSFVLFFLVILVTFHIFKNSLLRNVTVGQFNFSVAVIFIILFVKNSHYLFLFVCYQFFLFKVYFREKDKVNLNRTYYVLLALLPFIFFKFNAFYPGLNLNRIAFLGLMFMTLRSISALIEEKNLDVSIRDYFTYLAHIPTLLAGPVTDLTAMRNSFKNKSSAIQFSGEALVFISFGLIQRFIVSNSIKMYWMDVVVVDSFGLKLFLDILIVAAYVYFEFAGYSNMAVGLSKLLGIEIPQNFNAPFLALNPNDFWNRYHMSYSKWLKEYFFKPVYFYFSKTLYFRSHKLLLQNVILFFLFFLMGISNGISLKYILSGTYFAAVSALYNTLKPNSRFIFLTDQIEKYDFNRIFSRVFIVFVFSFGLYIFSGRIQKIEDQSTRINLEYTKWLKDI